MLKELNQKSSVCWIAPNEFNECQLWAEPRSFRINTMRPKADVYLVLISCKCSSSITIKSILGYPLINSKSAALSEPAPLFRHPHVANTDLFQG
jgi:hypothetical protein